MTNDELLNEINQLKQELNKFKYEYSKHQHSDVDGTNSLRKSFNLDNDQFANIGLGSLASYPVTNPGASNEQLGFGVSLTKDRTNGFKNKLDTLQLNFFYKPNAGTGFINAYTGTVVSSLAGTSITTSAGGNTVTINGYNFDTNELAGHLINIVNSSGTLIETQTIASNTSTVITISGTWSSSTSGGTFSIYNPVYLGSAETTWQRFYTQEGEGGGIRFGVGKTWESGDPTGQNGLLYMDSAGDLYWRTKAGVSVKLN